MEAFLTFADKNNERLRREQGLKKYSHLFGKMVL
jgi:hypothetical protein